MTFEEWLPTLSHDDKYNFDSEGRGYKKDAVTMMRVAFEAGRVAEREECFSLKKEAMEIFNFNPLETSQEVRDVIEWFSGAIRSRSTK